MPDVKTLIIKWASSRENLSVGVWEQQRRRPACASAQSDQRLCYSLIRLQGAHPSGKSQGNLFFLQGQGKVREFCKMVREIRKSSKVREKSGNFKIMLG